jgi:hypothetical protein
MADLQQYPLPNPGLPLGQNGVSPVAQTNPLQSLTQGAVQGGTLGLQYQAQQTEAAKALIQARQQQQQVLANKIDLLKTYADLYQKYAVAPSIQKQVVLKGFIPTHNDIAQMTGNQDAVVNPSQIDFEADRGPLKELMNITPLAFPQSGSNTNPSHLNDYISKFKTIEASVPGNPMVQQIAEKNISDMMALDQKNMQEKQFGFEQQKNDEQLEQKARDEINLTRGDQNFQKLEAQRNGAGGVYNILRLNQDEKGNYNLTKPQLVDLNSKMYTALNGTAPTAQALEDLNGSSITSLYSTLASNLGLAKNALPKQIGDRLLKMADDAGNFAQTQQTSMLGGRLSQMATDLPPNRRQAILNDASTRGRTFQQMKEEADKQSKYQPQNTPEAYLASIHAKVTPKNIEWAKRQMESNGK